MRIRIFCSALLALLMTVAGSTAVHAQAISGQGTWETTLQARDVGNTGTTNAFYDTALGITWLRDANVNGAMDWATANSWANNLTVGGVSGWRLPTMADPAATACNDWSYGGANCGSNPPTSSSEMASLFFSTLGNKAYYDTNGNAQAGYGLTNVGNFQNMQSYGYWFGTEYAPTMIDAWYFYPDAGRQGHTGPTSMFYGMAVRTGDVAAVPEPETYAMLLAGLGLIGAVARRHRSSNASRSTPWAS